MKIVTENKSIIFKVTNLYADNDETRADLRQEILLNLWKAFPQFKGQSKISTWMYRIAINTAISDYRRSKRHPLIEYVLPENIPESIEFESPFSDEKVNALYKAISKLRDIDKALVILYLEKKSYKEMSEIIGISDKNVSVKLVRIREKLKIIIEKELNGQ